MNERTEREITQRLLANRAAILLYGQKLSTPIPTAISISELDRKITLVKWAKAVVSAPDDEVVDSPEGFTQDELENAIINEMYRPQPQLLLVGGGQGRSDEEVRANSESAIAQFFLVLALITFVGLCFYFN